MKHKRIERWAFLVCLITTILAASPAAVGEVVNFPDPNLEREIHPIVRLPLLVNFPDANLEAAVRNRLGMFPTTRIWDTEMLNLYALDLFGVANLSGLEYAKNLRGLLAYGRYSDRGNQISDLTPLSGLCNLVALDLQGNEVSDLNPLAGLTRLEHLGLHDNNITSISPLADLTNMRCLGLPDNQIPDISAVSGMANLVILGLSNNDVTDITPLTDLIKLRTLGLSDNRISDISPLV